MATYAELNAILTDSVASAQALREKVGIAAIVAAQMIIDNADTAVPFDQTAGAHDQRLLWANRLLTAFEGTVRELFGIVVVANRAASQAQILNATDALIQDSVNETIDSLAKNLVVPV